MKRAIFLSLCILLLPSRVMASDACPTPSDHNERRSLAKEWFGKGERASRNADPIAAIAAFQCSLSLIPHGFTAFNLARVAEQVGDLELAISSYEKYLNLMPEAEDVDAIQTKIGDLRVRLAHARKAVSQEVDTLLAHDSPPATEVVPPTQAAVSPEPPQVERSNASTGFGAAAWITMGVGIAAIGTGIVFNVLASQKMDTSDNRYLDGDLPGAESAHDSAKRFAYTSYGLMAAGAVATAVGVTLGILPKFKNDVAIGILPGGLALSLGGRFQ